MRPGLPSSAVLHALLLAWILFGFPGFEKQEEQPAVDAMPIEFVPMADQSNIRLGQKTAKPKDEMTPKDVAKSAKEADGARAGTDAHEEPPPPVPEARPTPKPDPTPEPQKVAELPKEEPVKAPEPKPAPAPAKAEPAPQAKAEPVKAPEPKPTPAPPPKAPEPKPDLPKEAEKAKDVGEGAPPKPKDPPKDTKALDKLLDEQKKVDEKKAADAKAKAEADAKAKAEADAKAKAAADAKAKAEADAKAKAAADAKAKAEADAKAKAEADAKAKAAAAAKAAADAKAKAEADAKAKAAAAAKAAGDSKAFSSQISDVLNKNQTGSSQGREQKTASLGSTTGKIGVTHMTQAETDGLIGQIKKCWNPPIGAAEAGLKVTMRFALNADGSLSGQPELIQAPAHPLGVSLAASARRALMQCGPYKLPSDKYSAWQKVEATFDPKDL